jgi:hypothetical protein
MSVPETSKEVAKARRGRFQVGLRVLFLVTAAIAVWIAVFINRAENVRLTAKIERLRPLARDLEVDDPLKFAVVRLDDLWNDEQRWDVHLPPGKYRVCLAARDVDKDGFPEAFWSAPIDPGRHRLVMQLETDKSGTRVRVTGDGASLLTFGETKDWAGSGWVSKDDFSTSAQRPVDQPLVLHRRRLTRSDASGRSVMQVGPTEGLLLWIERTGGADQSATK